MNTPSAAYILHLDRSKEELPICTKHAIKTQMVADAIGAPFRFTSAPEGLACVHCKQENNSGAQQRISTELGLR